MSDVNNNVNDKLAMSRSNALERSARRLENKAAANALRKAKFKDKALLPKFAHIDLATYHAGVALLRCAYQPNQEFLSLCTHPWHLLLWTESPNRARLLNEAVLLLAADDEPLELQSLAQLLKQSLPQLTAVFENDQLPESAWLIICRKLIAYPVLGHPLAHLQAEQLYRFQLTQPLNIVAKPIWFALTVEQKQAFVAYSSSFSISRWFKEKLQWLKQVLNINKTIF